MKGPRECLTVDRGHWCEVVAVAMAVSLAPSCSGSLPADDEMLRLFAASRSHLETIISVLVRNPGVSKLGAHDLLLNPEAATTPPAEVVEKCRAALIKAGATGPVTVLEQPVVAPDEPWGGAPARGVVWIEVASSGWPIKGRSKGFAYVLQSMPPGGQVVGNLDDAFSSGRTQRRREYRRIDDRWFIYAAPQ